MDRKIFSARGAVSIPDSTDEKAATVEAVGSLIRELAARNSFAPEDLVHIMFTQTSDLKRMNAAAALREAAPDYSGVPLFCSSEPDIEGSPGRLVRILVTWYGETPGVPVYLGRAVDLRPDLFG